MLFHFAVIDNVLGIIHTTLGANVTVERSFGGTTPKTSRELTQPSPAAATFPGVVCSPTSSPNILAHPFEILVDPSIAIFLAKAPQKLQECAQTLHVQIEVDTTKNAIRVSPIVHFTQPGWQQQCNEAITKFIDSNCIKVEINIPQQATGEVLQLLVHTSQQETSFNFKISPDNTIATAVGEPDIIKTLQAKVEDVCSSHIQTEEQVSLTAEEYEFVSQVMQGEITAAHPGVSIQLSSADSSLLLKGSELANDTDVIIHIYAANGQRVRKLELGFQSAGYYVGKSRAAYWDGRNELGEQMASGVYFYQLITPEFTTSRKMFIVK